MQIVIPMAGSGKRFQDAGYKILKPLTKVHGEPIIKYVVDLFDKNDQIIYICDQAHIKKYPLKRVLRKISSDNIIVSIPSHQKGPVFSVLQAQDYIADDKSTIVNYCDFNMKWDYKKFKKFVKDENLDGSIVCYRGFHPHLLGPNLYASVRTDKNNNFLEIKEKFSYTPNKMDSWQSCGTYYFKNGYFLKKYSKYVVENNVNYNNEYYVSLLFNKMREDGLKIKVFPIDFFCQWGTPEDLEEYLYWSEIFKK